MPQIITTEVVAQSRLFTIEAVSVRYDNGVECRYERLATSLSGAVLIVPVTAQDELVLIREYGVGVERYELGFPKGKVEPGETWEAASVRECMEEAGYRPERLTLLGEVSLSASYMQHMTRLVLAEALVPARAEGDEPEPLEVVHWPMKKWPELLAHPEFTEGRAQAALLRTLHARGWK